jgi:class 3 adenylate cyclase
LYLNNTNSRKLELFLQIKNAAVAMKKPILLIYAFFFIVFAAHGQTVPELESQLQEAASFEAKVSANLALSQAIMASDPKKALDYAKMANRLSLDNGNKALAAQSALQVATVYEKIKDERNQEVWLKTTSTYAKEAGDMQLLVTSVERRSRLATRDQNYRRAYEINQEAFQFFSQKGNSIGDLENRYATQRANLEREKRALQKERDLLQADIDLLLSDRNQTVEDNTVLTTRQKELETQKKEVEQQVSRKDEDIAAISEEKKQAEELAKLKEGEVKVLSRDTLEKFYLLEKAQTKLMAEQLKVEEQNNLVRLAGVTSAVLLLLAMLLYGRYRAKRRSAKSLEEKNGIIEAERQRSDELLLNILPKSIAEELKTEGKARARRFEQVSVLFTDFVNFTRISEQLAPEELVEELDKCFKAFDYIIGQYPDIEKIKTIGDAYMCASGLSDRKTMPYTIVQAALDIQDYLLEYKELRIRQGKPFFEARIGIHTGHVVAGVVGSKKFVYDIWGDTVNTASRVESNGEAGQVNISEETYKLVKYRFDCLPRGKMPAKNKGEIDMYFVKKALVGATV